LAIANGRFGVSRDTMDESFCTGTYTFRDDRLWLSTERGWCGEVKFFHAAFQSCHTAVSGSALSRGPKLRDSRPA
jgi:hypothetical protein